MPLIAIVDASVLVSAFLFPESVPGTIVKLADQGAFTMQGPAVSWTGPGDPNADSAGVPDRVDPGLAANAVPWWAAKQPTLR
jgi:hypothetical protein